MAILLLVACITIESNLIPVFEGCLGIEEEFSH